MNFAWLLLLEFLAFSFLGWILDTGYRTYKKKKLTIGSYFPIPLCPIYGFGALALIASFKFFDFLPIYLLVLLGGFSMIAVEYFGALFSEKILRVMLWDYSKNRFNFQGRIDLEHSLIWVSLSALFYFLVFPFIP